MDKLILKFKWKDIGSRMVKTILFFVVPGFELTTLVTASLDKVSCFCLELAWTLVHRVAGITSTPHPPGLLMEMGVLLTFCPGWPQTMILPIFASLVGFKGVMHCVQQE
jgi:hypothetical protein